MEGCKDAVALVETRNGSVKPTNEQPTRHTTTSIRSEQLLAAVRAEASLLLRVNKRWCCTHEGQFGIQTGTRCIKNEVRGLGASCVCVWTMRGERVRSGWCAVGGGGVCGVCLGWLWSLSMSGLVSLISGDSQSIAEFGRSP